MRACVRVCIIWWPVHDALHYMDNDCDMHSIITGHTHARHTHTKAVKRVFVFHSSLAVFGLWDLRFSFPCVCVSVSVCDNAHVARECNL